MLQSKLSLFNTKFACTRLVQCPINILTFGAPIRILHMRTGCVLKGLLHPVSDAHPARTYAFAMFRTQFSRSDFVAILPAHMATGSPPIVLANVAASAFLALHFRAVIDAH